MDLAKPITRFTEEERRLALCIDGATNERFGRLVNDGNLMHSNLENARANELEGLPVYGTYLAALGEQHFVNFLRKHCEIAYHFSHLNFTFTRPVFTEETFLYRSVKIRRVKNDCLTLGSRIAKETKDGIDEVAVLGAKIGKGERPAFKTPERTRVFDSHTTIDEKTRKAFYSLLRVNDEFRVPYLLVAATVPATLLNLAESVGNRKEGIAACFEVTTFDEPLIGNYQTDIYLGEELNKINASDGFFSQFTGVIYREDRTKPTMSVYARVSTRERLNL